MTDVSGIPNMGFGGGAFYGGSGLNNAYAGQAQTNNYLAQQQAQLAAANAYNPWANTPGGFGGQTAYYAGLGAAYGRATGGFHPSVFTTGAAPYNAYGNPALGAGQPNYFGPSSPVSQPVDNSSPAAMAYLQHNPDVAASGMSAAQHWQNYGQKEGRDPWGMNLAGTSSVTDFSSRNKRIDAPEGTRFFDAATYERDNPDVFKAGADPWQHYNQYGKAEGRALPMSGVFDPAWYLAQYPDVRAAGVDPTGHYMQYGQNEGRAAGLFNTSTYKDPWAAGIPQGRNSSDVVDAVRAASQSTGLHPNALSALFGVESVWDPRSNTAGNPNWGVPQLSADMWGDAPFNGVINGKTWEQYKSGTAADQIGVFADWLNKSGSLTRGGLDFAAQPPEMQFALLMGNQLGGHYGMDWRNRIAAGDMTTPVYQGRAQAGELGNLSPSALIGAYDKRVARWPTQQTNWGP